MPLEIILDKEQLNNVIALSNNFIGKKNSVLILSYIYINAVNNYVEIIASDLEISIKTKLNCTVINNGCITLPGVKFGEIIRVIDNDKIHIIETTDSWVEITSGTNKYKMAGIECNEYPINFINENTYENSQKINSNYLSKMISKVLFSVASEKETLRSLSGVLVEKICIKDEKYIRMVTSDGHRLSIVSVNSDLFPFIIENDRFILSKKGAHEIPKFCTNNPTIEIQQNNKQIRLVSDNSEMSIKMIELEYPNYSLIFNSINKNSYFIIEKNRLLNSLYKIIPFTDDKNFNLINLNIQDNKLILTATNLEFGTATDYIKIDYNKNINVNINCKYIIDLLNNIEDENIKIYLSKDDDPVYITPEENDIFESIIMPIKV